MEIHPNIELNDNKAKDRGIKVVNISCRSRRTKIVKKQITKLRKDDKPKIRFEPGLSCLTKSASLNSTTHPL